MFFRTGRTPQLSKTSPVFFSGLLGKIIFEINSGFWKKGGQVSGFAPPNCRFSFHVLHPNSRGLWRVEVGEHRGELLVPEAQDRVVLVVLPLNEDLLRVHVG